MNTTKGKEFIRFGIVGILATALHYGIYFLLQPHINVNMAYTTGYIIGFIVNVYLTSYFTFATQLSWKKVAGMGGANLVSYLLHTFLLNLFLHIGMAKELAPLPVFAIAIPCNFILVRLVFKHKKT